MSSVAARQPATDLEKRRLAALSPASMAHICSGGRWVTYNHLVLLNDYLLRVVSGEIDRLLVTMPPQHGKPVYHGCMVLMKDGTRKRLADVEVGDYVAGHSRQPRRVLAVHEQGDLPAVRIRTFTGREVIAALDHPFLTPDGWVKAGELTRDHTLALLPEPHVGRNLDRPDEEFRLAGYFVGDGHTAEQSIPNTFAANITCYDPIEAEDIRACADRMGFVVKEPDPPHGRFAFSGKTYRDPTGPRPWLREIGLAGKTSWTKRVPTFVFEASPRQIAEFLGAYFACDGSLARRGRANGRSDFTVEFNSVSEELLADVRHLLLRLGIKARLRPKNSKVNGKPYLSWRLTITMRDDAAKFVARIPMVSMKAQRLASWATQRTTFDAPFIGDRIEGIERIEMAPCRCLTVEDDETFTVEDLVVHNSELISHWLPAWYLGTHPERKVLLGSYQARNAHGWGRKAREALHAFGPWIWGVDVADEPRGADWWFTDRGGYMASDGLGGAFTGKSAHLCVIDDPVKGAEEAQSGVMREKAWDWWVATIATRLQQTSAVVVVQTRWHEDDLAGRLLENEGGEWTRLNLPALAEDNDPLGREPGDPLCGELHSRAKLERQRRKGLYWWTAMYQGRPAPAEGFLFKRADFRYWREHYEPLGHGAASGPRWYVLADGDGTRRFDAGRCPRFQTVDAAISEKESADYTVVATWAVTPDLDLLLLDCQRRHFEEQQTVEFLAGVNDQHGRPPMWIERFGAGRNPLAILARRGHPVSEIPVEAGAQLDKVTRAFGAIALCERHKMFLPSGQPDWLGAYEDELASFPNAAHDDQVDVTSYAARLLPRIGVAQRVEQASPAVAPLMAGLRGQRF